MKRILTIAALAVGFLIGGAAMTDEARADRDWDGRRAKYKRYWRDYDRWYRRSYRPYYHHYYSRPYYNHYDYDRYYGTPRYGYYRGGGVNIGPLRIYW